jgi:hypothetical protein
MNDKVFIEVQHHIAEQGRKRLATEIQEARTEFAQGRCQPSTSQEMKSLFEETQSLPQVQMLNFADIMAEVAAYRKDNH